MIPSRAALALALCPIATLAHADAVDNYLRHQMRSNHIPGLAVAVLSHGKLLKLKGYGMANLEWNEPVTPDTVFQLASTTKALTGTAVMRMVQQGKIALDDHISKYIPNTPASWQPITIRMLEAHSSGVPDVFGPDRKPVTTVNEAVELLTKLPLEYQPGEKAAYGSGDLAVLSAILERVSGKPFPSVLSDTLLKPLGMSETRFDGAVETGPTRQRAPLPHRASVYTWNGDEQREYSFLFPIHSYSAGGIYSSVRDLAKLSITLDGESLLSERSKKAMWQPQKLNSGEKTSWGIGWIVRSYEGRRTVGHSGGPALSDVLRFPDDGLTVIVLQNQQRMYPYLAQGIADLYLPPQPKSLKPIPDLAPETTRSLYQLLEEMSKGQLKSDLFADGHQELQDDVRRLLIPFCGALPPLRSLFLTSRSKDGEDTEFRYAALYGRKQVVWIFDLNGKGKITGVNLETP